ncbi:MAG: methyltransferase family protein [Candidatus Thorarchaeota archaeon]
MNESLNLRIFFLFTLIIFIIGFIWPLITVKRKKMDPHGTDKGASLLTLLSSISIFYWLTLVLIYIFSPRLIAIFPFYFLEINVFIIIGMILISLGYILEFLAIIELGINFRIGFPKEQTKLITKGVYRLMRNPMLLGIFFLVIGTFMSIPNVLTLISMILNIITFNSKAKDEEIFLIKRFGDEYKKYMAKVGRYLPFNLCKKK